MSGFLSYISLTFPTISNNYAKFIHLLNNDIKNFSIYKSMKEENNTCCKLTTPSTCLHKFLHGGNHWRRGGDQNAL